MPELPEVETVRRGLQELIVAKTIAHYRIFDSPKSFQASSADADQFMIGAAVVAVKRRAKVLLLELTSDYTLVVHLKMTGQLVYVGEGRERFGAGHPTDSLVGRLPDGSTRVAIEFSDGTHLYFNDQRKFGWIKLLPTLEVPFIDFMKKVGPEPLEDTFTPEAFIERFRRRQNTSIKAALLDQTVIAGVGNIYADESLWAAQIDPRRRVKELTEQQMYSLFTEVRAVMNLSIEKGGSTDRNYVNAEGKRGSYMDFANVFRREGQACTRCDRTIVKMKHAGRGTHFCPRCQQ